jgi:hypothetical protein
MNFNKGILGLGCGGHRIVAENPLRLGDFAWLVIM